MGATNRILRINEVLARTGRSRSSWYNALNPKSAYFDPSAPRPVKISMRSVGWLESEIEDYIQKLANTCREEAPHG